jgi:hypothetical protein
MKQQMSFALLARLTSVILGLFILLGLLGTPVLTVRAQSPSFVRILHASPYVGTADVFVDGSKLLSSFAFGAITDYASIPAGPHKVQIALVGKGIGGAALTQTLNVTAGTAYTVAAIGATPSSLSLKVFVDNNLLTPGTTKLRVYQLSPDFGSITVSDSGKTLLSGVPYQQASDYLTLSAGSHSFNIQGSSGSTTLPLTTNLKANMVLSILIIGMENGSPKIELVPAQATGLPSMPQTGSDPNAAPQVTNTQPVLPWLLGVILLFVISGFLLVRRRVIVR